MNIFSSLSLISQQVKSAAEAAHGVLRLAKLKITICFTYSWRRKAITGLRKV